MTDIAPTALIVGAGPGISSGFAAALAADGWRVALASRHPERLQPLADALGARTFVVDAADPASIAALFAAVEQSLAAPEVVLYNPSQRVRGELLDLDPQAAMQALQVSALGAFVTAQEAARRMLPRGRGSLFFTGATAGVKGFAKSSVFAMGKFALRGLAQSLARELGPQGIHVVHFVIDGTVVRDDDRPDRLTPQTIAASYMAALRQPPGAWSWEIELRSKDEPF
jgi:NAD(P)-dependent dehydrogenase (short-subunit alcohol dehydrogenase family)